MGLRQLAIAGSLAALCLTELTGDAAESGAAPAPVKPLAIGTRKQLLVDDYSVAHQVNVSRELGQVIKENGGKPVLRVDKPWEDPYGFGNYGSVLHDGGKFRMWYRPFSGGVAYAESTDGLHWHKPKLGIYDFDLPKLRRLGGFQMTSKLKQPYSGKDNNLLGYLGDAWCCFLDAHETDPAHKYKAAHYPLPDKIKTGADYGAALSHSPDGFRWTPYNQGKPVTARACDAYNQILWDEDAKVYRLYTRQDYGPGGSVKLGDLREGRTEIRGCRGMTNPDVKANPSNWTTVRQWRFDRERDDYKRRQMMAMTSWIYEGIHFGMMVVYEWPEDFSEGPPNHNKRHERDILNFYIGTCRGDDRWDLTWVYAGKPFIPRGPDGSFDHSWIWHMSNIVTYKDRHWIYYTGGDERHWRGGDPYWRSADWHFAIGLATLPLDRFVALQAKGTGTVTTRPFLCEGSKLDVNVDAKKGALLVEVLDDAGRPVPGFTRKEAKAAKQVDELRLQPEWQGHNNLGPLKGKMVQLRFHLTDARLYAFQVRP